MRIIKEAFSKSMPDWLRNKINEDENLKKYLYDSVNIRLDQADFIDYPVPKSNRDNIKNIENAKIVFFLLNGMLNNNKTTGILVARPLGGVWTKREFPNGFMVYDAKDEVFKYADNTAWNPIFKNCIACCYIEPSQDDNFSKTIKSNRKIDKEYFGTEYDPNRNVRYQDDNFKKRALNYRYNDVIGFDKSGYPLKDPKEIKRKLLDRFPEVAKTAAVKEALKKLENYNTKISEISKKIKKLFLSDSDNFDFSSFFDKLNSIKNIYNSICNMIENNPQSLREWRGENYFRNIDNYISYIEQEFKSADKSNSRLYVNWDRDDMWLDDEEDED